MEVLAEWERKLVAVCGEPFPGEGSAPGRRDGYMQRHTGRAVLGVVPYLQSLGLPEEDSVAFKSQTAAKEKSSRTGSRSPSSTCRTYPTSLFDAFVNEPDVMLQIVRSPGDLDAPDAIILPGSKNVMDDLSFLRQSGLARVIMECSRTAEIVGICGGYQMLGTEINDPIGVESAKGSAGLGLLPCLRAWLREKRLCAQTALTWIRNCRCAATKSIMGRAEGENLQPVVRRSDGIIAGMGQGRIWGTYLHGIFDADEFRRWFIDRLRERRGLEPLGRVCAPYDLEPAFDRLAEVVRKSLQMDELYRLMGLQ